MTFEFEGAVENMSAGHLEFVGDILKKYGVKNGKIVIEPVGQAGDNYSSSIKRIITEKDGKPFKMVGKMISNVVAFEQEIEVSRGFNNEHVIYTEVLPKFAELELKANIPESERLRYAKCYGSTMEKGKEIILLEDLDLTNFVILDRFKSLTSDTVKLILKNLVMYHSMSYVLKSQDLTAFEELCNKLSNAWENIAKVPSMRNYMNQLENDTITVLDKDEYKKAVKNSASQKFSNAVENIKYYETKTYSVIGHGDVWTNNVMFRLEGDKVVEACMVDYQLPCQNSPVSDILYMIFTCTDYETRSKHYFEWLDYYHNELNKRLSKFGLSANDFYTREELNADLWRQRKVALGQALLVAAVSMKTHEEAAKAKAKANSASEINDAVDAMLGMSNLGTDSMKKYKNRVEEVVKTFIELGYV